ncbi:uncharacterized protein BYT42DRAFT_542642 [Radiomyces spectabilis]|uniref:uncharacterized protein n=1 Tax=Radiomyces spectabilis TaxID=64574 RepID=UPI00221E3E0F|nr:uncharacterized protein BYT42DRAFT_542642 [Radiomyces spectabilis]KAI8391011.1 hypothetical protein BYT42DRAFT_542642 [Radiomyces spectabilis]
MTNAFTALSHKRNRSVSTTKTSNGSTEPHTKLSKLKSGLAIFTKLTNPFNSDKTKSPSPHDHRRPSLTIFLHQYLGNGHDVGDDLYNNQDDDTMDDDHPSEYGRINSAFADDDLFERMRYKQRTQEKSMSAREQYNARRNAHTAPAKQPLPSILVKNGPSTSRDSATPSLSEIHRPRHRHTSSVQSTSALSAPSFTQRRKPGHHVRHYSHVSYMSTSNITVNSEDLTAKEFADIAGIRILPEERDGNTVVDEEREDNKSCCCNYDDDDLRTASSRSGLTTPSGPGGPLADNEESQVSIMSCSSIHDNRSCRKPQIWDTGFWRKPGEDVPMVPPPPLPPLSAHSLSTQQQVVSPCSPHPSISTSLLEQKSTKPRTTKSHRSTLSVPVVEPPIMHELRRMNTLSTDKLSNHDAQRTTRNCVIRKGRFEIHLESAGSAFTSTSTSITTESVSDDQTVPVSRHHHSRNLSTPVIQGHPHQWNHPPPPPPPPNHQHHHNNSKRTLHTAGEWKRQHKPSLSFSNPPATVRA